jgi:hypothetical protein
LVSSLAMRLKIDYYYYIMFFKTIIYGSNDDVSFKNYYYPSK